MDEIEQAEGRAVWQRAQIAMARAFEAFGADAEHPENATLYREAIAAIQQAVEWVRAHPGAPHPQQDGLLLQGILDGLARAEHKRGKRWV